MMPAPMSRICVVGFGPLPMEQGSDHTAAGLRTWQLARGLADAGVDVELILFQAGEPPEPASFERHSNGFPVRLSRRGMTHVEDVEALRAELDDRAPAGVVGATAFGSFLVCRTGTLLPVWVDFFGDPFAEAQALSECRGEARAMLDGWWMAAWCLRRGDRFAAVSPAQRFALLGQLGCFGRLSVENAGTNLCAVVPETYFPVAPLASPPDRVATPFTVLYAGGFNSWVDGDTLVEALRLALAEDPTLHFVAAGGGIPGFLEEPWLDFVARMGALPTALRARVELPGRVSVERLESLEARCGCGVAPEKNLLERELGGQNRSLRWMSRGLAVVTTAQSELGCEIREQGLGLVYRPGDPRSLADAILELSRDRARTRQLGERARRWVERTRSVAATTSALVEWARAPVPAPDRASGAAAARAEKQLEMLRDQLSLEARAKASVGGRGSDADR